MQIRKLDIEGNLDAPHDELHVPKRHFDASDGHDRSLTAFARAVIAGLHGSGEGQAGRQFSCSVTETP
jgi:hypothetical protein